MASESANTAESAAANNSDEDAEKILRLAPRHAEAKVQPGSAPVAEPARTTAASLPAAGGKSLRRPLLFALLPVALLIGGYVYVTGGAVMSTDNAYVQADMVGISTDVSGIVSEVVVHDNQTVAKGDVLFKLDEAPFRFALDRADAQVGIIKNNLDAMRTTYKDMQAQIEQAKADVALDQTNFNRQQKLAVNNYTPQATLDASRNTLHAAQQKLASLNQQLAGIAANLNGNPDAAIEEHPRYKDALAARDEAARQLAHAQVQAPFSGIVTNVPALQPGQYLAAAATAFNIVSTDHVWVEASPKETELTYVAARPEGARLRRHLSGRGLDRHGREHQPGVGVELLAAAGREHERQLGQGRAAHPDARPRRQRARQAAAARRHERRASTSTPAMRAACRRSSPACSDRSGA